MNRTRKEWEDLEFSTPIQLDRDMVFEAREDILELYEELEKIEEIERKRWGSPPKPFGGHISGSG